MDDVQIQPFKFTHLKGTLNNLLPNAIAEQPHDEQDVIHMYLMGSNNNNSQNNIIEIEKLMSRN